jgi:hypothetical protein
MVWSDLNAVTNRPLLSRHPDRAPTVFCRLMSIENVIEVYVIKKISENGVRERQGRYEICNRRWKFVATEHTNC